MAAREPVAAQQTRGRISRVARAVHTCLPGAERSGVGGKAPRKARAYPPIWAAVPIHHDAVSAAPIWVICACMPGPGSAPELEEASRIKKMA